MSVKVAVRVRPFNQREKQLKCECVVEMQNPTTRLKAYKGEAQKDFTFDYSFWSFDQYDTNQEGYLKANSTGKYADQEQVYNAVGKTVLDNAWQGYHCCLFAYGQTGSGKSYSMIGYGTNKGIVPISLNEIFNRISAAKGKDIEYEVNASMLEIYNEEIQDLTIPPAQRVAGGLKIRQNKLLGVYVEGVKKHFVTSFKEIQNVMDQGTKNRTVAATQMNATSSRAHTIITVEFKQIQKIGDQKTQKISMINLVDLAGSERQDKTGATGQRLKQAVGINQSLTTLGQVISVLAENSDGKNNFVPYRNSALTRILENALGGNSQTIMICAISPANDNYDQTLSTLRYAERAKKIKNKPIVNESESDKLIKELKAQNERLKKLLEQRGGNAQVPVAPTDKPAVQQTTIQNAQKPAQQKPSEQKPAEQKPIQQKPVEQKPTEQKPVEQKPTEQMPLQHKPTEQKPVEQKPTEQKSAQQKPVDQKPIEQKPTQQKPVEQKPVQQKPVQKKPQNVTNPAQNNQTVPQQQPKPVEQKKPEQKTKPAEDSDDDDDEVLLEKIKMLEQMLENQKKSASQKASDARKDQQSLIKGFGDLGNIFKGKQIEQMKKRGQRVPPYLENISKDIMIDRKIKIFIDKPLFLVGRDHLNPPSDLILGGRDVQAKQAEIRTINNKVFVTAIGHHVYVNGLRLIQGQPLELAHLDRVVFGWNSVFLFKNKDPSVPIPEKYLGKFIDWWFVKTELFGLVDIDESDSQDGGSCCEIY